MVSVQFTHTTPSAPQRVSAVPASHTAELRQPWQQVPATHCPAPASQVAPSGLLEVVQFPEELHPGFLQAPAVQVSQASPPWPQAAVVVPASQEVPARQPVQQVPLLHTPGSEETVQLVPSLLLEVVQLPEAEQPGFLHGLEVEQLSQLAPLSPQRLVVLPG